MTMNDLISNYLTRIRNAIMAGHETVENIPASNVLVAISELLKREGYIKDFRVNELDSKRYITIDLRYTKHGKPVISHLERVSKPGRRVYVGVDEIPYVRDGLGIAILSTSKGVITDEQARKNRVGGEILCKIW